MPTNAIITSANGETIKDAFERIVVSHLPNQRWLGSGNYYKSNTIDKLETETVLKLVRRKRQIEEYIAASVIIHNTDAWNYLSSSIESLLNGDISNAIHLAYYAELRSSMSLMAFEGIGIFNNKHIWFDSTTAPNLKNGPGTHKAVTDSMNEWSKLTTKKDVLFKLIRVNNNNLGDWLRESGVSARSGYASAVVNRWLKKWSIDLHLEQDRYLRNEMSYRPHFETTAINARLVITKLTQIWDVLEPTAANRFPLLDKYLLRFSLEEIYKSATGRQPSGVLFENFVTNIFGRLGEDPTLILFDFLLRRVEPNDHLIFEEALKDSSDININRDDPFPIICRALLLLRLSTGAAQHLISESSLDPNSLRFWWEQIALQHGSIQVIPSGIDAIDLYTDIRESIDEINNLPIGSMNSIKEAFTNVPEQLFYIKQFQRTAIWGIGL